MVASQELEPIGELHRRYNGLLVEFAALDEVLDLAVSTSDLLNDTNTSEILRLLGEKEATANEEQRRAFELSYTEKVTNGNIAKNERELVVQTPGDTCTRVRRKKVDVDRDYHFREFTEHLDSVFWLWSLDERRLLYVSPAYERIWGRSRESLSQAPHSYMRAIHPADRDHVREALRRIRHDAVGGLEYRVLQADGTTRWVCSRGFPVRDGAGRVYRVAGITEDITHRKEAEAERERVLEILGHDLRNPLAAILLSTELAMTSADVGGAAVREPLENVVAAVAQMQTLVDDILTAATLRGGGITLHIQECDASALVQQALQRIRPLAAAKGIAVEGLTLADLRVPADAERIQQVFANLLSNAVRLTPSGGRIEVRAERRRNRLWFSVADTGPGIPDEEIPHLFERYWQSDRTSRGGAGLGLTIAKGIVEAHGGHIWATSHVGKGSCFVFSLSTASPQPPRGEHPASPGRS